ncbi:LuxR C-terminal-related transcriptional regulator [Enterobacter chuandaensis]|uniref:LuxR C-terminal-related transcriptional regulator n=1 Tax=Enterobacter chuandaensis TaxID=2497875 RepID=UPI001C2E8382|nr:LuxR C-terminal-related transcriptional regulator [Enterobacter chuandaensis]
MEKPNIVVVTNNRYFSRGIMSLLTQDEQERCTVWTPAQVGVNINKREGAEEGSCWIVDADNYFNNTLLFLDLLTALVDIKTTLNRHLRVLLCYNRYICMPSLDCYACFSMVNAARGIKSVEQKVRSFSGHDRKDAEVTKSGRKTALTRQEYLVLNALSQGQNVSQVADRYHITPKRVSHHKCSGLAKMKKKRLYGVYGE